MSLLFSLLVTSKNHNTHIIQFIDDIPNSHENLQQGHSIKITKILWATRKIIHMCHAKRTHIPIN